MPHAESTAKAKAPAALAVEERNERVMQNQGLVHQIARGFKGKGVAFEDLVQYGNIGLIRSAERFDPGRGLRFSTFASFWIRQAIYKGLATASRPIRVPQQPRKDARAVLARQGEMEAETGVRPSLPEVVASMEARGDHSPARSGTILRATEVARARFGVKPLEEVIRHATGPTVESVAIDAEHREMLDRAMDLLPDDQREVLTLRYGLDGNPPLEPPAVAALLGISRGDVDRAEWRGQCELRRLLGR